MSFSRLSVAGGIFCCEVNTILLKLAVHFGENQKVVLIACVWCLVFGGVCCWETPDSEVTFLFA